jgi:ubiquinol-cytochrome c reductase iron-sulfur subunit
MIDAESGIGCFNLGLRAKKMLASTGHPPNRRDFMSLLGMSMFGVGAAAMFWPLLDSLNPAAGAEQESLVYVDLSTLAAGQEKWIFWRNKPVVITRPTAMAWASLGHAPRRPGEPAIFIVTALCTLEDCKVLSAQQLQIATRDWDGYYCPCCASRFDVAGHRIVGPAKADLVIPPHRFDDPTHLVIGEEPFATP